MQMKKIRYRFFPNPHVDWDLQRDLQWGLILVMSYLWIKSKSEYANFRDCQQELF